MKILVVEDKQIHQQSARDTLVGHDVTIIDSFDEAMRLLVAGSFEVVLTDMMMPMSRKTLARDLYDPEVQVPYGFVIALRAALCGAKFVAMLTDTNHHKSAISAALDHIGGASYHAFKPNFEINGAKAMFVHTPFVKDVIGKGSCYWCDGSGSCETSHGIVKCTECTNGQRDILDQVRKDWGRVLADLTDPITDSDDSNEVARSA
jgi:CheY-like chemotaxis protein